MNFTLILLTVVAFRLLPVLLFITDSKTRYVTFAANVTLALSFAKNIYNQKPRQIGIYATSNGVSKSIYAIGGGRTRTGSLPQDP